MAKNQIEQKDASFLSLETVDAEAGTFKGYIGTTGELDDVGDIILQGGFKETAPNVLVNGFFAADHTWNLASEVGIFTYAVEDERGLYVEGVFHNTPDAQMVRQKMLTRIQHKKPCKTSIGYRPSARPVILYPSQYERELPRFLKPSKLQEGLAKAVQFDKIRILPKVEVFEGSGVQIPANPSAELTSVKSLDGQDVSATSVVTDEKAAMGNNNTTEKKDYFAEAIAEIEINQGLWPAFEALREAIDELQDDCAAGECATPTQDLRDILNSFAQRIYSLVAPRLTTGDASAESDMTMASLDSHLSVLLALKDGSLAGLSNAAHSATVHAAVAEYEKYGKLITEEVVKLVGREQEIIQLRLEKKSGRTISQATSARLKGHCDSIKGHCGSMKEMASNLEKVCGDLMKMAQMHEDAGMGADESQKATAVEAVEEKGQSGENKPNATSAEEAATSEEGQSSSETVETTEAEVSAEEKSANPAETPEEESSAPSVDDALKRTRQLALKQLQTNLRLRKAKRLRQA